MMKDNVVYNRPGNEVMVRTNGDEIHIICNELQMDTVVKKMTTDNCKLAGYDVKKFSFIACEKTAPYVSHLHVMGNEIMHWGMKHLHKTLATIAKAEKQSDYSTNWGDYTVIEKPAWL